MFTVFQSYLHGISQHYWLTRYVFLRLLGIVYFFAFLSLLIQVIPLLGSRGLTPADKYIQEVKNYFKNKLVAFWEHPTLFWFHLSDNFMLCLAWSGMFLSFIVAAGYANKIILALLWLIYMSFVHVGQVWYGYGWETELLENGFTAIFLVGLVDGRPFAASYPPPVLVIFLLIWIAFRVNFGSGMIKLRSDKCWKDLTCLYYHFETQPLPNPFSPWFHFLPRTWLRFGVWLTLVSQVVVPWFLFVPGAQVIAAFMIIFFQLLLMLSGNLSFLNLITIAPLIAAIPDNVWANVLPQTIVDQARYAALHSDGNFRIIPLAVFVLVAFLSIPSIKNLMSAFQMMNASFNQFHIANAYGAFGGVGKKRYELVVSGTQDDPGKDAKWKEYEFLAKPTGVNKRMPLIAPYQPRLDWQIWFAAMQSPYQNEWMYHFIWKLLHNDPLALRLISLNPFPERPPRYIKVDRYLYSFAPPGSSRVWDRIFIEEWLPPLSTKELSRNAEESDWEPRVRQGQE
jgi:hypothetical protein